MPFYFKLFVFVYVFVCRDQPYNIERLVNNALYDGRGDNSGSMQFNVAYTASTLTNEKSGEAGENIYEITDNTSDVGYEYPSEATAGQNNNR